MSVYKMGRCKNVTKTGREVQGYTSPTPSFQGGKAEDTAPDLIEEVLTQIGMSPKVPFRFTQSNRLPSTHSLSPEGGQACSMTPDNKMCYCIPIRLTLEEREATSLHLPTHGVNH